MNNNISPDYLSSLEPQSVETTTHSLRDATNIRQSLTRTQLYYNSFIPSRIRLWNDLPVETIASNTFTSFRYQINKNIRRPPNYYTVGDRFAQIQHTRLRTSCSSLNQHLFSKNIISDPYCLCGSVETTKHYLLECQSYSARTEMINRISRYRMPNLIVYCSETTTWTITVIRRFFLKCRSLFLIVNIFSLEDSLSHIVVRSDTCIFM